jgi:hypothetical protein
MLIYLGQSKVVHECLMPDVEANGEKCEETKSHSYY